MESCEAKKKSSKIEDNPCYPGTSCAASSQVIDLVESSEPENETAASKTAVPKKVAQKKRSSKWKRIRTASSSSSSDRDFDENSHSKVRTEKRSSLKKRSKTAESCGGSTNFESDENSNYKELKNLRAEKRSKSCSSESESPRKRRKHLSAENDLSSNDSDPIESDKDETPLKRHKDLSAENDRSESSMTSLSTKQMKLDLSCDDKKDTEPQYPVKFDPNARALDDWVPIQDSFLDVKVSLSQSRDNCSEVDRVLKFILSQQFFVRCLNVVFAHRGSVGNVQDVARKCPNFKIGPFNKLEREQVEGRFDQLVREAEIQDPVQILRDFNAVKQV